MVSTSPRETFVPEMLEVVLGSRSGDHVLIRPIARQPERADADGLNCVVSRVEVVVGGFRGAETGTLRCQDFVRLLAGIEPLHETLQGEARFETMEDWLSFTMQGNGRGHVYVQGELRAPAGSKRRLVFDLSIDQTDLALISQSLKSIGAAFPVRG